MFILNSLLRNFVREEVSVVYCCKLLSKRVREGLGWGFSLPLRPWLDYMLMWLVHNTLYILLSSCSWGALKQRTVIILPFSFFTFSFTLKKLLVQIVFKGKSVFLNLISSKNVVYKFCISMYVLLLYVVVWSQGLHKSYKIDFVQTLTKLESQL